MPQHPAAIRIDAFNYHLPDERIARYPLARRSDSKLLVYKNEEIHDVRVGDLNCHIPNNAVLIFNNTKVVEARLHFTKEGGSAVEVFCLHPAANMGDITQALMREDAVDWICLLGGAKKWRDGETRQMQLGDSPDAGHVMATRVRAEGEAYLMHFEWNKPNTPFVDILHQLGEIPLPPYLNRAAEESDKERYQTVYARQEGSVAAPTAGLHFTPELLAAIDEQGGERIELTLHVGAGTFKPVKSETLAHHTMHTEHIDIGIEKIESLIALTDRPWIPVGTTAMRTLETLYHMGLKAYRNPKASLAELIVKQWDAYEAPASLSRKEALLALYDVLKREQLSRLLTETQILIAPGYAIKMADALMTNFHQPQSTLLLLISAIVGDAWKGIYQHALDNQYRFLSYGDSSLLWLHKQEEKTN
ncbi:MAG: S-adenosylmethionine:tRNA ribosyltransferase-isomerase [Chitinophagaceae bacterium]|nr:S-adenosylmethionine:tRNA ribosyltransferase-isomerase [Chitinophagaceae bacterium]